MNPYIISIIIIVFVSILSAYMPRIKGWMGEKGVSSILSRLSKDAYIICDNIMVRHHGKTTQIDHVVVSIYGIFVIETKNYKGWIYGGEYSKQWTKNVYGKTYAFQNPILQNYGHVKTLKEILQLEDHCFIPIVVFTLNADLKVETKQLVVYTKRLYKTITSFQEKMFTQQEIQDIAKRLCLCNVDSKQERKQHVQAIRQTLAQPQDGTHCPRCGAQLVERKGKYGTFMGCSQFPKCRYTLKNKRS